MSALSYDFYCKDLTCQMKTQVLVQFSKKLKMLLSFFNQDQLEMTPGIFIYTLIW